jgi:hypothetical protein
MCTGKLRRHEQVQGGALEGEPAVPALVPVMARRWLTGRISQGTAPGDVAGLEDDHLGVVPDLARPVPPPPWNRFSAGVVG